MRKTKLIILLPLLLLLTITSFACAKRGGILTPDDVNSKINHELLTNKEIGDFQLINASMNIIDGTTTFTVTLVNSGKKDLYVEKVLFNFYDSNGQVTTLIGFVSDIIEPNDVKILSASHYTDLGDSVSLKYEIVK